MRQQDCTAILLARGRLGIVDAALVRWLTEQRTDANRLVVHVTKSVFEPWPSRQHVKEFLAALEPVDEVVRENELAAFLARSRTALGGMSVLMWPEAELLDCSVDHIWKRHLLVEEEVRSRKLTTLGRLCALCGPSPRRRESVGVVSGTFDLIHPGHVRLFVAAKQMVDVLVVLAMSTGAIRQQEKNQLGDRPIYNSRDRIEVLSAPTAGRPHSHVR